MNLEAPHSWWHLRSLWGGARLQWGPSRPGFWLFVGMMALTGQDKSSIPSWLQRERPRQQHKIPTQPTLALSGLSVPHLPNQDKGCCPAPRRGLPWGQDTGPAQGREVLFIGLCCGGQE